MCIRPRCPSIPPLVSNTACPIYAKNIARVGRRHMQAGPPLPGALQGCRVKYRLPGLSFQVLAQLSNLPPPNSYTRADTVYFPISPLCLCSYCSLSLECPSLPFPCIHNPLIFEAEMKSHLSFPNLEVTMNTIVYLNSHSTRFRVGFMFSSHHSYACPCLPSPQLSALRRQDAQLGCLCVLLGASSASGF